MKRAIYLVYLMILLSAVSWRLANASSTGNRLKSISIVESENFSDLILLLDRVVKPVSKFSGHKNCLTLDFPATELSPDVICKAVAGRDVKLAYIDKGTPEDGFVRLRLYIRQDCLASVRFAEKRVLVRLTEKSGMLEAEASHGKVLLNPFESNYSPAVISLQDAPFEPAVRELAGQAGIDLKFAGSLPESFSVELEAVSPLEALKSIAEICRLRFFHDGKVWVMAGV